MALPKETFAIAGGFIVGLVLQVLLSLPFARTPWPTPWIVNVGVTLAFTVGLIAVNLVDAAKGLLFAALARAMFNLALIYGLGVLGGSLSYRLGH